MFIEVSKEETTYLVKTLKDELQTDLVVKLLEKLEKCKAVQEAAERGANS